MISAGAESTLAARKMLPVETMNRVRMRHVHVLEPGLEVVAQTEQVHRVDFEVGELHIAHDIVAVSQDRLAALMKHAAGVRALTRVVERVVRTISGAFATDH
jgi:hypothetical protein